MSLKVEWGQKKYVWLEMTGKRNVFKLSKLDGALDLIGVGEEGRVEEE